MYHIDYLPRNDVKYQKKKEKKATQNILFNVIHIKEIRVKKKEVQSREDGSVGEPLEEKPVLLTGELSPEN